jgi:hypothetical protein
VSGVVRYLLRLPADMHATIKALAERDRRSMHAEMLVLLEEALDAREQQRGEEAA